MVQRYRENERPERFDCIVQSWDTANKATELSDYSVCTTWGVKGKDLFLLDVFRRRLEYPALKRAVRDQQSLSNTTVVLIKDCSADRIPRCGRTTRLRARSSSRS